MITTRQKTVGTVTLKPGLLTVSMTSTRRERAETLGWVVDESMDLEQIEREPQYRALKIAPAGLVE